MEFSILHAVPAPLLAARLDSRHPQDLVNQVTCCKEALGWSHQHMEVHHWLAESPGQVLSKAVYVYMNN